MKRRKLSIKKLSKLITEDVNTIKEWINEPGLESRLIDNPEEAQEYVQRDPQHGEDEASEKIYTILIYGPEHKSRTHPHTAMDELKVLAQYWEIDADEVLSDLMDIIATAYEAHKSDPDEMNILIRDAENFINANRELFRPPERPYRR